MQDKRFMQEMAVEAATAFQAGKMDRRTFLTFCGLAGVATLAVTTGNAEAAAKEIVMWNWGGHPSSTSRFPWQLLPHCPLSRLRWLRQQDRKTSETFGDPFFQPGMQ